MRTRQEERVYFRSGVTKKANVERRLQDIQHTFAPLKENSAVYNRFII